MKTILLPLAIFAVGAAAIAQNTAAFTEAAGFSEVTIPAASPGNSTRRVLAVPYQRPAVYQGTIADIQRATVSLVNAAFSPGQFTTAVHFVKVRSGANAGRYFRITSHTDLALTVDAGTEDLTNVLAADELLEVFPAQTLASLFGATGVAFKTGATPEAADNVRIHDGTNWVTYFHDGSSWRKEGEPGQKNDTVILPDQAVFVICKSNAPVKFTLTGAVSTSREITTIPGAGEALVGSRHPVEQTLKDLALDQLPGWRKGDSASVADTVLLWNGIGWDFYYHTGQHWEKAGAFGNADDTPIPGTSGLFIKRQPGGTAAPGYISSTLQLPPL